MKKYPTPILIAGLLLLVSAFRRKKSTAAITLYNGQQTPRGCDDGGCGHFGAPRGDRTHEGFDLLCVPGAEVVCPPASNLGASNATYQRDVDPYGDGQYSGIQLFVPETNTTWKIMYMQPLFFAEGQIVLPGQVLGYAQDISDKYASVAPHLHIEILQDGIRVDPEPYLF